MRCQGSAQSLYRDYSAWVAGCRNLPHTAAAAAAAADRAHPPGHPESSQTGQTDCKIMITTFYIIKVKIMVIMIMTTTTAIITIIAIIMIRKIEK